MLARCDAATIPAAIQEQLLGMQRRAMRTLALAYVPTNASRIEEAEEMCIRDRQDLVEAARQFVAQEGERCVPVSYTHLPLSANDPSSAMGAEVA